MTPITATIEVARPARDVFDYATDPSTFREWQKGVVEGHLDTTGEVAVGDHCVSVRRIGLANRVSTSEITQLDPPCRWSIRGIDGPIRAHVDVLVDTITDQRSRLSITIDFEGRGIGRLLVPLVVEREARKEMPANLDLLRRQLETATR